MKTPENIVSVIIYGHERELPESILLSELITPDQCIDAMKDFSKICSIGFFNWMKSVATPTMGGYVLPMQAKVYSIEELYEEFIKK